MTGEEEKILIEGIEKVKDPIPPLVYNALATRFPHVTIEIGVLRKTMEGKREILLIRRLPNDKFWTNLWHVPGTIIRNRESFNKALQRLMDDEFCFNFKEKPEFITWINYLHYPRGHEISLVYRHTVESDFMPPKGKFFPISDLPADIVKEHRWLIPFAAYAQRAVDGIEL